MVKLRGKYGNVTVLTHADTADARRGGGVSSPNEKSRHHSLVQENRKTGNG